MQWTYPPVCVGCPAKGRATEGKPGEGHQLVGDKTASNETEDSLYMTVSGSEKGALEDTQCLNLQGREGEKERGYVCVRERGRGWGERAHFGEQLPSTSHFLGSQE